MPLLDHLDTCAAIDLGAARLAGVLRSAGDPGAPAVGTWTTGEVANHLCFSFANNSKLLRGEPLDDFPVEEIPSWNARGLAADPERDLAVLADRLAERVRDFLGLLRSREPDEACRWYAGIEVPASAFGAIMLSEVLVHGDDIAGAAGRRWPIDRDEARTVFAGVTGILPHFVERDAARGLRARIGVALRGGPRVTLAFHDAALAIEPYGGNLDCRLSVEPVAFLLVSYGRRSPAAAALTGRMVAWGRKPWLGARLPRLLRKP